MFHALTLENVVGLMDHTGTDFSNLDYCEYKLASVVLRLAMFAFKLNPLMFGFPSQRWRLWMFAIMQELLVRACCTHEQVDALARHTMQLLTTSHVFDVDTLLLPNEHPLIEHQNQRPSRPGHRPSGGGRKGRGSKVGKAVQWPSQHARLLEQRGLHHWELAVLGPAVLAQHPGLAALTDRQFDILRATGISIPSGRRTMIDSTMSGDFAKPSAEEIAHIGTPTCELYISHLCRLHHGIEAMHMQGLHFNSLHSRLSQVPEAYASSFLTDLAGNSFHVWCAALVLVVREVVLAFLHARIQEAEQVVSQVPPVVHAQGACPSAMRRGWTFGDNLLGGASEEEDGDGELLG
jgi:hypothetical protein